MLRVREYLISDVVVIGAGIAGCRAAVEACEYGASVILVNQASGRANVQGTNNGLYYSASISSQYPDDNWKQHAKDTFEYGEGTGDISLISLLCKEALRNAWELERYGIAWARNGVDFELSMLEGHSYPRGLRPDPDLEISIPQQLDKQVNKHVGIKRLDNCFVTTILMEEKEAVGIIGLDQDSGDLLVLTSGSIVLACGGMSGLFSFESSRGSIIGEAYKLGAELISPETGYVYICEDGALNTIESPGGLRINQNCQTNIKGLYAAGEAAGGIHGANVLPGNSLPEAVVFGGTAGKQSALERRPIPRIKEEGVKEEVIRLRKITKRLEKKIDGQELLSGIPARFNSLMVNSCNPENSYDLLKQNVNQLNAFKEEWNQNISIGQEKATVQDLVTYIQLEGLLSLASVVLNAAVLRQESRSHNQRIDSPEKELDCRKNITASYEGGQDTLSLLQVENDFAF